MKNNWMTFIYSYIVVSLKIQGILAWACLKGVSSLTSPRYLWGSFSLLCAQKLPSNIQAGAMM